MYVPVDRVSFLKHLLRIWFLLEGFLGGPSNWINLRFHFAHCHVRDTIVILEEGNWPYPRFPQCDIFVSHKALNGLHMVTAFCQWVEESKRHHLEEKEARAGDETAITVYGITLAMVKSFKFLGRILMVAYNDWPVVVSNLRKARRNWAQLTRLLGRERAYARTLG